MYYLQSNCFIIKGIIWGYPLIGIVFPQFVSQLYTPKILKGQTKENVAVPMLLFLKGVADKMEK